MIQPFSYEELCEMARPSSHDTHNIVYIQFRDLPKRITMSDFYRVERCYVADEDFDQHGKPFSLSRFGRGKSFSESDGFKRKTYGIQWVAFPVRYLKIDTEGIEWEVV